MSAERCHCCQSAEAAYALRARAGEATGEGWRHAICLECLLWLQQTVGQIRADSDTGLLGSPSGNGRAMLFDDQCQVCRVPGEALLTVAAEGKTPPWKALTACPSCAGWLGSLAAAGASARGRSFRVIDGHYGDWPHPNLRTLSVEIDVGDYAARAAIAAACEKMGVATQRGGSVLLTEASKGGYATKRMIEDAGSARMSRVVLSTMETEGDLRGAVAAGADDWLTLPLTPQQVSGALTRALRQRNSRNRDEATLLPRIVTLPDLPPVILIEPETGTSPFQAAWYCRRFARGYDEIGAFKGAIALFPRAPSTDVELVRVRLERLLTGRCVLRSPGAGFQPPRFEAAG